MKRITVTLVILCTTFFSNGQTLSARLATAFAVFQSDTQMSSAAASLYVVNARTGDVVFANNERLGLAPASTQKIITGATAYELLGKTFRYKTAFGYKGELVNTIVKGNLFIQSSGDPTLGSWRWKETSATATMNRVTEAVKRAGISGYRGITVDNEGWREEAVPDGWIWQDIGNYYGAGAHGLNWRENQFDVVLSSGNNIGSKVRIVETVPSLYTFSISSLATAAAKGTGDNAYIYHGLAPDYTTNASTIIRGTIPVGEKRFIISGSFPEPSFEFAAQLMRELTTKEQINVVRFDSTSNSQLKVLHTETSPPLDSIIYWFNKKSINLYGEALLKTIGFQQKGRGSTDAGVEAIKNFWSGKGIVKTELNIVDGSGLSPLNRVTTHAQVEVLKHAKAQPWFSGFYLSLPEYNGMKMKSGTIRDVKGFCGYHTSKDGTDYIFSFLVNNYNGAAATLVQKMYAVLNVLK